MTSLTDMASSTMTSLDREIKNFVHKEDLYYGTLLFVASASEATCWRDKKLEKNGEREKDEHDLNCMLLGISWKFDILVSWILIIPENTHWPLREIFLCCFKTHHVAHTLSRTSIITLTETWYVPGSRRMNEFKMCNALSRNSPWPSTSTDQFPTGPQLRRSTRTGEAEPALKPWTVGVMRLMARLDPFEMTISGCCVDNRSTTWSPVVRLA